MEKKILEQIYDPDFLKMRKKVEYYLGMLKGKNAERAKDFLDSLGMDHEKIQQFFKSPLEFLSMLSEMDKNTVTKLMKDYSLDYLDIFTIIFMEKIENMDEKNMKEYIYNLTDELKCLNPLNIDERKINEMMQEIRMMDDDEIMLLKDELSKNGIHPYITRILTDLKSKKFGVVIDGSNVYRAGLKSSIFNFERLLLSMSKFKHILFPIRIVFDKNIIYMIKAEERKKFEKIFIKSGKALFHSPADELILKIAQGKNYFIISKDRFKDYDIRNVKLLTFDDKFRIIERK